MTAPLAAGVFAPGFFGSGPVHTALLTGAVVAVVSGAAGVFTVLRGQSFAGHAFADLGTLGGSAAFLLGIPALAGYVGAGVAVAGAMEASGAQRRRSRDVATGVVLGAVLGVSALLLYLDTTSTSMTGASVTILFGSLFTATGTTVPATIGLGALGLAALTTLYRPLLLTCVSTDLAGARGIPVRGVGLAFLTALAVAMALSSMVVGTILSPALLIGPAAVALRLTRRAPAAMALAAAIALAATWLGVLLAYDSYRWPPRHDGWPVSFFVTALIFAAYLATTAATRRHRPRTGRAKPEEV